MYRIIAIALMLAATCPVSADYKHFEVLEHAAEVMELELSASKDQLVYARRCDQCPTLALSIDPRTAIYDGRKRIAIGSAAAFDKRGGTLFFDPETRRVTRIVFWATTQQES